MAPFVLDSDVSTDPLSQTNLCKNMFAKHVYSTIPHEYQPQIHPENHTSCQNTNAKAGPCASCGVLLMSEDTEHDNTQLGLRDESVETKSRTPEVETTTESLIDTAASTDRYESPTSTSDGSSIREEQYASKSDDRIPGDDFDSGFANDEGNVVNNTYSFDDGERDIAPVTTSLESQAQQIEYYNPTPLTNCGNGSWIPRHQLPTWQHRKQWRDHYLYQIDWINNELRQPQHAENRTYLNSCLEKYQSYIDRNAFCSKIPDVVPKRSSPLKAQLFEDDIEESSVGPIRSIDQPFVDQNNVPEGLDNNNLQRSDSKHPKRSTTPIFGIPQSHSKFDWDDEFEQFEQEIEERNKALEAERTTFNEGLGANDENMASPEHKLGGEGRFTAEESDGDTQKVAPSFTSFTDQPALQSNLSSDTSQLDEQHVHEEDNDSSTSDVSTLDQQSYLQGENSSTMGVSSSIETGITASTSGETNVTQTQLPIDSAPTMYQHQHDMLEHLKREHAQRLHSQESSWKAKEQSWLTERDSILKINTELADKYDNVLEKQVNWELDKERKDQLFEEVLDMKDANAELKSSNEQLKARNEILEKQLSASYTPSDDKEAETLALFDNLASFLVNLKVRADGHHELLEEKRASRESARKTMIEERVKANEAHAKQLDDERELWWAKQLAERERLKNL